MAISVSAVQSVVLTTDTDGDGVADPGETLTFSVTIENTSDGGEVLTGLQFEQILSGVTLVPGTINVSPLANDDAFTAIGNTLLEVGEATAQTGPQSSVAGSVISNDTEFLGDSFTIDAFDATSANGGTVTMVTAGPNAGSFTYISDAGFTGADTFTYTIRDAGIDGIAGNSDDLTSTATVTITVTDSVWYVDSANGSDITGDGTSLNPFASMTQLSTGGTADALDGADDTIYVQGIVLGSIVLETGQQLVGTGVDLVVGGFTLASDTGSNSDITGASGFTVTLAGGGSGNNTIAGIDINGVGGISGSNFGTLTVNDATIDTSGQALGLSNGAFSGSGFTSTNSDGGGGNIALANVTGTVNLGSGALSGATGHAVSISGGNGSVDFNGTVTHTGNGGAIIVANKSGGTVSFDGAVTSSAMSSGVSLTNNAGTTMNFTGGLTINTSANGTTGFNATGGGTVNVVGAANTVNSGAGTAINVSGTTIGASGMTWLSANSSGGGTANGINLVNAGSGGFTITGQGSTAGSGGTFGGRSGSDGATNSGIGIYIQGTDNVSLSNIALSGDFGNFGIRGVDVNNFTLRDSTASANAADNGGFGTSNAHDEGVISFDELTGTALFEGNNLSDGHEDIIVITNTSGTLNFTVQDSANDSAVIGRNGESVGTATGNDGILVDTSGSASLTMNVTGVVFEGWRGDGIQVVASGTSTQNITIANNTFHNAHADIVSGGGGAVFLGLSAGTGSGPNVTYAITGNSIRGAEGNAITVSAIGPSGAMSGTILNNTIGNNNGTHESTQANTGSSSGGSGIFVRVEKDGGSGTLTNAVRIDGNNIGDIVSGTGGIHLLANGDSASGNGTARLEATITNNVIDELGANAGAGIYADVGGAGGNDDALIGVNIQNNVINMTGATNAIAALVFGDLTTPAQYYFPGYGGPYDDSGLAAFHTGAEGNTLTVSGFVSQVVTGPSGTFATGNNFVLPVPILAASLPTSGWEGAVWAAQQQAWLDYLASQQGSSGSDGSGVGGGSGEPAQPLVVDDGVLTDAELALIVDAAIARWEAAGASEEQLAAMRAVSITIDDMGALTLGASAAGAITIDDDAGGWRWFIDATPDDDAEYAGTGTQLVAVDANGQAGTRIDLLTVIMHELGHQIGLADEFSETNGLMYGMINAGERRLPGAGEAGGAVAGTGDGTQYIGAPISIGTLNPGQSITIEWDATIDSQTNGLIVDPQNSGTVSWTGPSAGTQPTNTVTTTLDTLTLGNLVFLDINGDGAFDGGDSGIDGVALTLFADDGTVAGVLDDDDTQIATTTTAGGGLYSFAGLAPGDYIVQVDGSNFTAGSVLEGRASATGSADPDDNVDNDDNGAQGTGNVVSSAITLAYNTEPDPGTGNDTNNTLDFGFLTAPPVVTLADPTVDGTEDVDVVFNAANGNAITVADPDSATLTVTLTVTNGRLTLAQTTGLTFLTGDGTDNVTMEFSGSAADINAALEGLVYRGNLNFEGTDTLTVLADDGIDTDSEDVTITLADDGVIHGDTDANVLNGTAGNDYFDVSQGGEDTVNGLGGMDRIYYGAAFTAADQNDGGDGAMDVVILQGTYALTLGTTSLVGIEYLSLQSGSVTRWGDTAGNTYTYDITTVDENVGTGERLVINGQSLQAAESFTFDGSAETDGAFLIFGGRGTDTFTGGDGDDIFFFEEPRWNATDTIDGGDGMDAVAISMGDGLNVLTFGATQFTSIESISVNNRFASDPAQIPSYLLVLNNGNVAAGQTLIVNGQSLDAGQTLEVDGSQIADGRLRLFGGDDNDVLIGGANDDEMMGGLGADAFAYTSAAQSTVALADEILDFEVGTDVIDLSAIDPIAGGGDEAFTFIGSAAFSNAAGELRAEFDSVNNVWEVEADIDGDGSADFLILVNATTADPLTGADFIL